MDVSIIYKYFPELNNEQQTQFAMLGDLYAEWNEKINVISRKDIDNLYERHVLHALGIAKVIDFKPNTKILDVGTGGGFPGIPLAIMFPEVQFYLVDSIGKKIRVVEAVAEALGLKNIKAEHQRAEKVKDTFDFVVARAVTNIKPFYNWVKTKVHKNSKNQFKNGILYLKGGDLADEFLDFRHHVRFYELGELFEEPFFETKKVVYIPL